MRNPFTELTPLISRSMLNQGSSMLWRAGAAFVATGVVTGAFGAHGLKKQPNVTPDTVHAWETAAHYAVVNGVALLAVSMHPRFSRHAFAGPAIIAGTAMFSGSIFALTVAKMKGLGDKVRILGPITPLGGSILIAGYLALLF
ncbi:DUF423-domain-containing protein [Schizophyllum commune H4-8]|uniref:DUF423-domain-containing protein n=1 Tax=Schizophyllum commune (strain H4-8 / FGSC 9210) TaxID=578458 RepID=UPI00215F1687|nr:DUF423-domain-containing protein [Schizophyllum commune H4-8]KAI5898147.1 DUF423-domain-containing protein [Schizophyllum commune H4-8]